MAIRAEMVLDSISPADIRLCTIAIEMPRFLLAEANTHRVFSRSYASSRAVPVAEMLRRVQHEPFVPTYWGKNQKGMQANEECNELLFGGTFSKEEAWVKAAEDAAFMAHGFNEAGYHKQLVNRLVEPFSYVTGIITATEWENFFLLRDSEAAQPEFRELAVAMRQAMDGSTPNELQPGEWHLPYVRLEDELMLLDMRMNNPEVYNDYWSFLPKLSAARCARASFASNQRGQNFTIEQDLALYERLVSEGHYSPLEHQASPMQYTTHSSWVAATTSKLADLDAAWPQGTTHLDRQGNFWSGNFKSWVQARHLL